MKGDQGNPGPSGKIGETGLPGATGLVGPKGIYFQLKISTICFILMITFHCSFCYMKKKIIKYICDIIGSRGDQGIKGDLGLMGMPGRTGERGPPVKIIIHWFSAFL